jgi:hypothetical protein
MENCTYERFTLLVAFTYRKEEATDLKWPNHKYKISNIHIYRRKKLSNLTWTTTSMRRDSPLLVAFHIQEEAASNMTWRKLQVLGEIHFFLQFFTYSRKL